LEEFKDLEVRFNQFADIENIKALEEIYLPKIIDVCSNIDNFRSQLTDMREVITRFDYNLTLKANKNLIDSNFYMFSSSYLKKDETWKKINKITEDMEETI
tara:strand:+ start:76 stop:378 length:303 start_codon:yes stop_codon:yes gene_type:complete